jgi:hypothetical protein
MAGKDSSLGETASLGKRFSDAKMQERVDRGGERFWS